MAILVYIEENKQIILGRVRKMPDLHLQELGRWHAHNEVASSSHGKWPKGVFNWAYYNRHSETGALPSPEATSYGTTGIHVFDVPGRTGMGVHAGRSLDPSSPGGKTLGCIRVPKDAMLRINEVHRSTPLTHIAVHRNFSHLAAELERKGGVDV